ncbi:hypothetical protein BDP27DRAFT_1357407 [Rhodocollybia butyracea]|uniref:Uncharacterized protein n=1 Tax=Rhodocollybia butyracea TaxID=206335 RepID=A0A9P5Q9E6_9AGAR|nr:hypothetical protein BDP27DRAFT_1357407 [Rhodocollybia butyracea]
MGPNSTSATGGVNRIEDETDEFLANIMNNSNFMNIRRRPSLSITVPVLDEALARSSSDMKGKGREEPQNHSDAEDIDIIVNPSEGEDNTILVTGKVKPNNASAGSSSTNSHIQPKASSARLPPGPDFVLQRATSELMDMFARNRRRHMASSASRPSRSIDLGRPGSRQRQSPILDFGLILCLTTDLTPPRRTRHRRIDNTKTNSLRLSTYRSSSLSTPVPATSSKTTMRAAATSAMAGKVVSSSTPARSQDQDDLPDFEEVEKERSVVATKLAQAKSYLPNRSNIATNATGASTSTPTSSNQTRPLVQTESLMSVDEPPPAISDSAIKTSTSTSKFPGHRPLAEAESLMNIDGLSERGQPLISDSAMCIDGDDSLMLISEPMSRNHFGFGGAVSGLITSQRPPNRSVSVIMEDGTANAWHRFRAASDIEMEYTTSQSAPALESIRPQAPPVLPSRPSVFAQTSLPTHRTPFQQLPQPDHRATSIQSLGAKPQDYSSSFPPNTMRQNVGADPITTPSRAGIPAVLIEPIPRQEKFWDEVVQNENKLTLERNRNQNFMPGLLSPNKNSNLNPGSTLGSRGSTKEGISIFDWDSLILEEPFSGRRTDAIRHDFEQDGQYHSGADSCKSVSVPSKVTESRSYM